MDPSLQELLEEIHDPEEELEVIMRLVLPSTIPEKVKVIASFGDVITCRIKRKDVDQVYKSPLKFSLKASKYFLSDVATVLPDISVPRIEKKSLFPSVKKSTDKLNQVVVGIIDWGCDFTHPNFKNNDGTTRLLAIWDQSFKKPQGLLPYGYGKLFTAVEINNALRTKAPFKTLNYHPAKADGSGIGAHGTHVMDIAAGNGQVGQQGMAPNAELAFVHLHAGDTGGKATLGDSVRILEAIDFLKKVAGNKPLVINMSVGRHGGPHDGNTLVERAIDNLLEARSNTMLCQSTGNYYKSDTHATGLIRADKVTRLSFLKPENDNTPDEIEIWYSGKDIFNVLLKHPMAKVSAALDSKKDIIMNGQLAGRIYHRKKDPVNLKNHINIFLYKNAPRGMWEICLSGEVIVDGRFNAWIERDSGCKNCQSKFISSSICKKGTTGTICNGFNSLVVGAYNPNANGFEIGNFSSGGPTTDGRHKPDLLAPGVKIMAAKSSAKNELASTGKLTIMSGTSMAAPHVTGAVARVLEIVPPGTAYYVIRNIINGSAEKINDDETDPHRIGNGILSLSRAIQLAELYKRTVTISKASLISI
jgi:subtilisin family serine protease